MSKARCLPRYVHNVAPLLAATVESVYANGGLWKPIAEELRRLVKVPAPPSSQEAPAAPALHQHEAGSHPCARCGGTGRWPDGPCDDCLGSGRLLKSGAPAAPRGLDDAGRGT